MVFGEWLKSILALVTKTHVVNFLTAVLIVLVAFFLARRARDGITKLSQFDVQQRLLLSKIAYFGLLYIGAAAGLRQIGFELTVLLGAAGVLTVAIGFAAQTSASNLISGIFLMVEKPFIVGDVISVGEIRGEVMSIDMLSSKIRTFNNLMIRIPNETLVKSNITNLSYFPIRRLDFNIGIAYHNDSEHVETVLKSVAAAHPLCLDEPHPEFVFVGFGDSAMNVQFQVWTTTANLLTLQNELYRDIKRAFDRAGIEIPYPTRTMVTAKEPIAAR